jgi:ATP-dependent 26S proteasome regulatory subunit
MTKTADAAAVAAAITTSALVVPEETTTMAPLSTTLDVHIRARYPLISVSTFEESRLIRAVETVANFKWHEDKTLYTWSRVSGLIKRRGKNMSKTAVDGNKRPGEIITGKNDALSVLEYISAQDEGIFVLCDFGPHLAPFNQEEAMLVRMLRELAWKIKSKPVNVIFVEPQFPDIATLQKEIKQIDLKPPCEREVAALFDAQVERLRDNPKLKDNIIIDAKTRELVVQALLGLTESEIGNAISKSVIQVSGLTSAVLPIILAEKKDIIRGVGALAYSHPQPLSHLGGFHNLLEILTEAAVTFTPEARARDVDPMKGVLLVGLPGNGKDLAMTVASSILGRPLLKLDMGAVMGGGGGVIGSGAMSIRRALTIAETVKGILGISEFEKGVGGLTSSNKTDGGETSRTIAHLLNWMSDQNTVFTFATANDVRELAGEQIRQGRFSYIAFVDNPKPRSRAEIAAVHLRKRNRDPEQFNLEEIADATPDFNGAEVEAAVTRGILTAFMDGDRETTTNDIVTRARKITPLAKVKPEQIEELRKWARDHMAINAEGDDGAEITISGVDHRTDAL